jgi:hypothetical protein
MAKRAQVLLTVLIALLAAGSSSTAAAPATAPVIGAPMLVSGPDPLPACTGNNLYAAGWAWWPQLAVNPRDPSNVIIGWSQDGMAALASAATHDGGRSWQRNLVPGFSICENGGPYKIAEDAWLSFDASGQFAYLSGDYRNQLGLGVGVDINDDSTTETVTRSDNGGGAWTKAAQVDQTSPGSGDDKNGTIIADPSRPGRGYIVWEQNQGPSAPGPGRIAFSRTENGGRTWTPASTVYSNVAAMRVQQLDKPIVAVLRDGTLVVCFLAGGADTATSTGVFHVLVTRSTDHGRTWSEPVELGRYSSAVPKDRASGKAIATAFGLPTMTVGPDGTVYVMWADLAGSSTTLRFSQSADGLRWSQAKAALTVPAQAALPAMAVAGDGTLGVIYYDTRQNDGSTTAIPANWWLAFSRNHGRSWHETHLAGPFDLAPALKSPNSTGLPVALGIYAGLAAAPDGFAAAFPMSGKPAVHGTTDIFYTRIETSLSAAAQWRTLPSNRRCVQGPRLTIHLRAPRGASLEDAAISVNGRRVRYVHGRRVRLAITLLRLPPKRFTVSVIAHTRSGRLLRASRIYRTCPAGRSKGARRRSPGASPG